MSVADYWSLVLCAQLSQNAFSGTHNWNDSKTKPHWFFVRENCGHKKAACEHKLGSSAVGGTLGRLACNVDQWLAHRCGDSNNLRRTHNFGSEVPPVFRESPLLSPEELILSSCTICKNNTVCKAISVVRTTHFQVNNRITGSNVTVTGWNSAHTQGKISICTSLFLLGSFTVMPYKTFWTRKTMATQSNHKQNHSKISNKVDVLQNRTGLRIEAWNVEAVQPGKFFFKNKCRSAEKNQDRELIWWNCCSAHVDHKSTCRQQQRSTHVTTLTRATDYFLRHNSTCHWNIWLSFHKKNSFFRNKSSERWQQTTLNFGMGTHCESQTWMVQSRMFSSITHGKAHFYTFTSSRLFPSRRVQTQSVWFCSLSAQAPWQFCSTLQTVQNCQTAKIDVCWAHTRQRSLRICGKFCTQTASEKTVVTME